MKLLINIFITLAVVFIFQPICYANPIPGFWLFGWIDADTSDIYEYDGPKADYSKYAKLYHIFGSDIYEYDGPKADYSKYIKVYHPF